MTEAARGPTARTLDYYLQNVVDGVPNEQVPDVALDDSRPTSDDLPGAAEHRHRRERAHQVHHAMQLAESVLVGAEFGMAGSVLAHAAAIGAAPIVGMVGAGATGVVMGYEVAEAHRQGQVLAATAVYDRMRGALSVFEGRADTPAVRREIARNPEFAAGVRKAQNDGTRDAAQARALVRRVRDEAFVAVSRGEDRGAAFLRRYHGELAFRHAVDEARAARAAGLGVSGADRG